MTTLKFRQIVAATRDLWAGQFVIVDTVVRDRDLLETIPGPSTFQPSEDGQRLAEIRRIEDKYPGPCISVQFVRPMTDEDREPMGLPAETTGGVAAETVGVQP